MIQSPCMKICIFDQESGYCLGCSRTEEEVIKWKDPDTTDEWKKNNLKELLIFFFSFCKALISRLITSLASFIKFLFLINETIYHL